VKIGLLAENIASFNPRTRLGETAYAFGFPMAGLLATSGNFTTGNVSALMGDRNDVRLLQVTTPIQPGNSGGPLLDGSGRVVGVVASKLDTIVALRLLKDVPQNVNFAIKSELALTFMSSHGVDYTLGHDETALPPPDIAVRARSISVMVECAGERRSPR
jgi:hypothetical protein